MNNCITEISIVAITIAAILVFGVEAKDIAIAAIAGLTGYLTKGGMNDNEIHRLVNEKVSKTIDKEGKGKNTESKGEI